VNAGLTTETLSSETHQEVIFPRGAIAVPLKVFFLFTAVN